MTKWYVKDLSKITGVSVQTLHHYDHIDLLKPSLRLPNGYRVYSEKDLLQLQQIIALKFFGFELSQIKALLTDNAGALEHFSAQAQFLEQKAYSLLHASKVLKTVITEITDSQSIPWESIIKLIEVYHMSEELKKTWAGQVFNSKELTQYAHFESELKTKYTPEDREQFTQNWLKLVNEIKAHLDTDPKSDIGMRIGKEMMTLIGGLYGKENANLKRSIWEKGFKKGKMEGERSLEPAVVAWLDKAIDNYWRTRIYTLLDQVELSAQPEHIQQWNAIMDDMYGHDEEAKQAALRAGEKDVGRIGPKAKKWLTQFAKK